nr:sugar phosphate isomerase/epimerase [uncultured Agathobacter sp.]
MIKVGVQTKGILPEMGLEKGVALIAAAGFERVDFNLDTFLKNSDVYAGRINTFFDNDLESLLSYFEEYRKMFEKYGIKPSQMHAPYPILVPTRADVTDYMQKIVIPKSIAIAGRMQIPWVVMHPFKLQYKYGLEVEQAMNLQYFQFIIPMLKEHHVGVCVENLYEGVGGRITEGTCANPTEAAWYVDVLNQLAGEELFGCCLDTGHMELTHREPADYIRQIGSRLKILHMHENDAIGDLHQMPYTFGTKPDEGVDWEDFCKALGEIGFDGTLSFETFPCVNSFPRGAREEVLRTIMAIGEDMVENVAQMSKISAE